MTAPHRPRTRIREDERAPTGSDVAARCHEPDPGTARGLGMLGHVARLLRT